MQQQQWATSIVLCVTGVPHSERASVKELVERAGGSYCATLSRRCTHLAVPADARAHNSEKLRSAQRNQHKWGLRIVSLWWLIRSAEAGARLPETDFPVQTERTSLTLRPPPQPAATTVQQQSGGGMIIVANTCRDGGSGSRDPPQTPLGFRQPASLHTQSPELGSPGWASCASPGGGQPSVQRLRPPPPMPAAVQQAAQAAEQAAAASPMAVDRLPMTQAGFLPTDALLAQLLGNAGQGDAYSPLRPVSDDHDGSPMAAAFAQPTVKQRAQQQRAELRASELAAAAATASQPDALKRSETCASQRQQAASPPEQLRAPIPSWQQLPHVPAADALPLLPPHAAAVSMCSAGGTTTPQSSDISQLLSKLRSLPKSGIAASAPATQLASAQQQTAAAAADLDPTHTPPVPAAPSLRGATALSAAASSSSRASTSVDQLVEQLKSMQQAAPGNGRSSAVSAQPPLQPGSSNKKVELLAVAQPDPRAEHATTHRQQRREGTPPAPTEVAEEPRDTGDADQLVQRLQELSRKQQQRYTPLRQRSAGSGSRPADLLPNQGSAQQQAAVLTKQDTPPAMVQRQVAPAFNQQQQALAAPPTVLVTEQQRSSYLLPTEPAPAATSGATATPGSSAAVCSAAASAAVTPPTQREVGSQVADSARGVFAGMVVQLDDTLPADERERVAEALQQGGGEVAQGVRARGAGGATHVVCDPQHALRWLSMGLAVVSPAWVLRSLKEGKQQRCLMVSADASRALPAAAAVPAAGNASGCVVGSTTAAASPDQPAAAPPLSSELLASRDAREQVLSQLLAAEDGNHNGSGVVAGALLQSTPAELLSGLEWSVAQLPAEARLAGRPGGQRGQAVEQDPDVIPDSEEEEEQELLCLTSTQAVVGELLEECRAGSAGGSPSDGAAGPNQQLPAWMDEIVLRGPSMTLLLPRDGRGELGHASLSWELPGRQLSAGELLHRVHAHYAHTMSPEEVLALLKAHPGAHAAAALLKPAFLELKALQRVALLGPRSGWEGLVKATREPAGSVYELRLGC